MGKTVQRYDWLLILPLIAAIAMIAEIDGPSELEASQSLIALSSWAKGLALAAVTLVVSLSVAAASAIDRRCSEEYVFQIMANAALVAFGATMLINLAWLVGIRVLGLPELSSENIIGVLTLAWTLSYYWFRMRGISA